MQKDELLKKVYELGFAYERDYRSCSQCTVGSIQDTLGMRNDFIFKAAYGLAGGYANLGDGPCGGYSGGSMMISLFFGRRREFFDGDLENKRSTKEMVTRLHDNFIDKYGSVICKDVQRKIFGRSFDLRDREEMTRFDAAGGHTDKATEVVGLASQWALKLILEEVENRGLTLEDFEFLKYTSRFPY
jgi:C_GCAxxG_C_C family probable redox protein